MSLMGLVMTAGIAVSNSILIVEFTGTLRKQGRDIKTALIESCKARLRPILMTSLATILGLIPMALALEPGSEQYAPLARAILGGLTVSVVVTVFLVPAAYLLIHRKEEHCVLSRGGINMTVNTEDIRSHSFPSYCLVRHCLLRSPRRRTTKCTGGFNVAQCGIVATIRNPTPPPSTRRNGDSGSTHPSTSREAGAGEQSSISTSAN